MLLVLFNEIVFVYISHALPNLLLQQLDQDAEHISVEPASMHLL